MVGRAAFQSFFDASNEVARKGTESHPELVTSGEQTDGLFEIVGALLFDRVNEILYLAF